MHSVERAKDDRRAESPPLLLALFLSIPFNVLSSNPIRTIVILLYSSGEKKSKADLPPPSPCPTVRFPHSLSLSLPPPPQDTSCARVCHFPQNRNELSERWDVGSTKKEERRVSESKGMKKKRGEGQTRIVEEGTLCEKNGKQKRGVRTVVEGKMIEKRRGEMELTSKTRPTRSKSPTKNVTRENQLGRGHDVTR